MSMRSYEKGTTMKSNPNYNQKWIYIKVVSEQPPIEEKGVKDLKREEEAIFEQSSRRDFGGHPISYEHNSYDCYEGNRFGTRNDVRNGGNYVNMDEIFHKRKGDNEGYYDSYNYGGHNYRKGIEDKGRNMEKELGAILEELPINLSLNPSLMCYESYLSHVSIIGDICAISVGDGLFLVIPHDSLSHSGSMFDPFSYDFGVMNNASIESIVGFGLDGALFDILHDKCLGKFVENVGYVPSFFDTFMENHNDLVSLNQHMSFVRGQVEFSCNEQKLSNVINSLNTLFENTFGFQFYHLHFREILLKDIENRIGANLELFKVNPLAFEKSILRKEAFEQVDKCFFVEHLYYHKPFKDWFSKLFILCASFQKNSCAFILKHKFEDTLFIHLIFKEFFDRMIHEYYSFILNTFMFIWKELYALFVNGQQKFNKRYTRWMEFIEAIPNVNWYKRAKRAHCGGLMDSFCISNTYVILHEYFFGFGMKRDVERFINNCLEYKRDNSTSLTNGHDVNQLDMQEYLGVVTRAKPKPLKSHKDQIEQEKFQGLNFDVQDLMGLKFLFPRLYGA
ncbi:hypothetical protein M9H77_36228 [Catharanthus roseus]|uniref:Uncharacterized protein n=1 Tax=Catharanthus roseus TaxID=4058 RepID=A0ACB9ZRL2_CATRO|nr:hypothetical protein M9H77_36228 [Catharanthus roseus]